MFYYTSNSIRQMPLRTKIGLAVLLIAAIAALFVFGVAVFLIVAVAGLLSFLANLLGGRPRPSVPPNSPHFHRPPPQTRKSPRDDDVIDI